MDSEGRQRVNRVLLLLLRDVRNWGMAAGDKSEVMTREEAIKMLQEERIEEWNVRGEPPNCSEAENNHF